MRRATVADAAQMGEIYVAAWREAYPSLLPHRTLLAMSAERWTQRFASTIRSGRDVTLVAEDQLGKIVGLVTGGRALDTGLFADHARITAEIYTLYVSPNHEGCGVGSGLTRAVLADFARRGHKAAAAWMLKGNPARFFYERVGARLVAEKSETRFGRRIGLEAYGWADLLDIGCRSR